MGYNEIERLKKDHNKILHYRTRLLKKGKTDLAYKMSKKADYINQTIQHLRAS